MDTLYSETFTIIALTVIYSHDSQSMGRLKIF